MVNCAQSLRSITGPIIVEAVYEVLGFPRLKINQFYSKLYIMPYILYVHYIYIHIYDCIYLFIFSLTPDECSSLYETI